MPFPSWSLSSSCSHCSRKAAVVGLYRDARLLVGHESLLQGAALPASVFPSVSHLLGDEATSKRLHGSAQRLADAVALFGLQKPLPAKTCLDETSKQTNKQTNKHVQGLKLNQFVMLVHLQKKWAGVLW